MDLDAQSLEFMLGAVLVVALLGGLPPIIRVVRITRAERILGWRSGRYCTPRTIKEPGAEE
jgi:hypothetical protein